MKLGDFNERRTVSSGAVVARYRRQGVVAVPFFSSAFYFVARFRRGAFAPLDLRMITAVLGLFVLWTGVQIGDLLDLGFVIDLNNFLTNAASYTRAFSGIPSIDFAAVDWLKYQNAGLAAIGVIARYVFIVHLAWRSLKMLHAPTIALAASGAEARVARRRSMASAPR
jgi:hypothetical protein